MDGFNRAEYPSAVPVRSSFDKGKNQETTEQTHRPDQPRTSQLAYRSAGVGNPRDQVHAQQQRTSAEFQRQEYEITGRIAQGEAIYPEAGRYGERHWMPNMAGRPIPFTTAAPRYAPQASPQRFTSGGGSPRGYPPQPASLPSQRAPPSSTPMMSRHSQQGYSISSSQGPGNVYSSSPARETGMRHDSFPPSDITSSYSPSQISATPITDRSTSSCSVRPMSPNSLRRELESMKDYSDNVLTQLMDTERRLKDREAEVVRSRDYLDNNHTGGVWQRDGDESSRHELENLRHQVFTLNQQLQAAKDDLTRERQSAQYHQLLHQSDRYSQQSSQFQGFHGQDQTDGQQDADMSDRVRLEEAQKVIEVFKQTIEKLSKDNKNLTQQNRKLIENLTTTQR